MGTAEEIGPWAGVLLSDEEAMQIIAVLADVLDGHDRLWAPMRTPRMPVGPLVAETSLCSLRAAVLAAWPPPGSHHSPREL
jgi:hypothetical protein